MIDDSDAIRHWWRTSIIDMEPGRIAFRGHPIEDLIGNVGFGQMIWLMTRGALPSPEEATLLECALVAGVDHGPHAPSIAAASFSSPGICCNPASIRIMWKPKYFQEMMKNKA